MSQKSITSFFKPIQENKRKLEDVAILSNKRLSYNRDLSSPVLEKPINSCVQIKIDEQTSKTSALSSNIGHSWFLALKDEFSKPYFSNLSKFLEQERKSFTVYPPKDEVFSWTRNCDIQQVKVVILGQDPYHGTGQAHGLSFSVKKGVAHPPSLINIFKEVKNDYPDFVIPKNGDLTGWANQGVLMLNACLTVRANNANSHANKGWEQLTDAVIKYFNTNLKNRVFILWGAYAQKKGSFIDQKKHLVLKSVHPSPLSAHRGFFGCGHFAKANEYLQKSNNKPIDWTKLY